MASRPQRYSAPVLAVKTILWKSGGDLLRELCLRSPPQRTPNTCWKRVSHCDDSARLAVRRRHRLAAPLPFLPAANRPLIPHVYVQSHYDRQPFDRLPSTVSRQLSRFDLLDSGLKTRRPATPCTRLDVVPSLGRGGMRTPFWHCSRADAPGLRKRRSSGQCHRRASIRLRRPYPTPRS